MIEQRPSILRVIWTDAAAFMSSIFAILLAAFIGYDSLRGNTPDQNFLLIFGGIILVALGVLTWRLITIFNLFNDAQEATATITDISFYRDRGRVTYIFMYQNQKYINGNAVMKNGKTKALQIGEQSIVLVNRDNPKISILRDLFL